MVSQIRAYGATVVPMEKKADRWAFLERAASDDSFFITSPYQDPVIGSHPVGIEGYKTIAYEIFEQSSGRIPDWCVLPVCYGDALSGLHAGFEDLRAMGKTRHIPRLVAAEIHGSLSAALKSGGDQIVEQPASFDTVALSIGTTRSTFQALHALRQSNGIAVTVSNEELFSMQSKLARKEGIFSELASVAPLVAIERLRRDEIIERNDRVVSILTASGMKDIGISAAGRSYQAPFETVDDAWEWAMESRSESQYRQVPEAVS